MSKQQYSSIGSDNGLALTMRQAIVWINDGLFTDTYMRNSASMSKQHVGCVIHMYDACLANGINIVIADVLEFLKCYRWYNLLRLFINQ